MQGCVHCTTWGAVTLPLGGEHWGSPEATQSKWATREVVEFRITDGFWGNLVPPGIDEDSEFFLGRKQILKPSTSSSRKESCWGGRDTRAS